LNVFILTLSTRQRKKNAVKLIQKGVMNTIHRYYYYYYIFLIKKFFKEV